jgi:isoquinoline 1-oxidoreductase
MRLVVNGARQEIRGDPSRSLLFALRDGLGLRGSKQACGEGVCGACTVLVDGSPVRSCVTTLADVAGRAITTIEGLASPGSLHPVQAEFLSVRAFQCGYCTPGMVLGAAALLAADPHPTDDAIASTLDGHVCRCGVHARVVNAVRRAADRVAHPDDVIPAPHPAAEPLLAPPRAPWDLRRPEDRDYFGALGDGLVVVLPPANETSGWNDAWSTTGGVWLHVGTDAVITAFTAKVEMGQGTATALAMIVGEAVGVPTESVRMVMADTDVCPYDEGTFGSRSVPDAGAMLEAAGRTARATLLALAGRHLEARTSDLIAVDGTVRSRDGGREIAYGELLAGERRLVTVPARGNGRTSPAGRTGARTPPPAAAGADIVTGGRTYVTDIVRPGMLFGDELRPPVVGARLRSVDLTGVRPDHGVTLVHDGDFVGVTAEDEAMLGPALAAIRADWDVPIGPSASELAAHLRAHPIDEEGWDGSFQETEGDVDAGLDLATTVVTATYHVAYAAHFSLESRAAVAEWSDDRVTVWTATQAPFWARAELAETLRIGEDRVRVIVPRLGGGFGGKHGAGAGLAAARLARATGRPVRVRWRHGDEFIWGHVRPAAVIDIRAGVTSGSIEAWDVLTINGGANSIRPPYRIRNQSLRFQPADSPLPQSSYRALAATANTFARESAIDELAVALGADPLEFRLATVADERLASVLRAAAERAGWPGQARTADGHGLGIAGSIEKDGRVATCAEVTVAADGRVRVERLVTAFDCGAIVDPENLRNQIEGATVMALGPALFEAVDFENGRVTNPTLAAYRVPRFRDVPDIEAVLVDRPDVSPAGGGETPLIAVAAALANAIFAASGVRLRAMPLVPTGFVSAPELS